MTMSITLMQKSEQAITMDYASPRDSASTCPTSSPFTPAYMLMLLVQKMHSITMYT